MLARQRFVNATLNILQHNALYALLFTHYCAPYLTCEAISRVGVETMEDAVRDLIIDGSPAAFWKDLVTKQDALYGEAYSYSYHGALWEKQEAETVFPFVRRAMFENVFRTSARAQGLKAYDMRHINDYPYVLVKTKRLVITAHHVGSPGEFVPPAETRKQNAAINKHLDYYLRAELLLEPLPGLSKSGRVNIYVLHGQTANAADEEKGFTPFLHIGIPDTDLTCYSKVYNVRDLLQIYQQREVAADIEIKIADKAIPRIKTKAQGE